MWGVTIAINRIPAYRIQRSFDGPTIRIGLTIIVNGLIYQVVDLDAEDVHLRRVTSAYFSDGRIRYFVYGGDQ